MGAAHLKGFPVFEGDDSGGEDVGLTEDKRAEREMI
jgi:hypothetical protein